MKFDFNINAISLAFRFYARTLLFPYDELTYEFQHLFREVEKNIHTVLDNTVANKVLEIINYYQGEEMSALQAEYTRMFTPVHEQQPPVSLYMSDFAPDMEFVELNDILLESPLYMQLEDRPDHLPLVLDFFSALLLEDPLEAEHFYERFLKDTLPKISELIYRGTSLSFYKEVAKGLNDLVYLLNEENQ